VSKVLILGQAKSGTTILFHILRESLPRETACVFEPDACLPPADTGGNALAKVLIERTRGYDHYGPAACERFDKRIFLRRDPRDLLVSTFLYAAYDLPITTDFPKFAQFVGALRAKEQYPQRVSLLDLLALQGRLVGDSPRWVSDDFFQNLRFAVRLSRRLGERLFHIKYEDVVDRQFSALQDYLGLPIKPSTEVDPGYQRVARSKGYGDWRNWFLPEDVAYFRPLFAEYMQEFGYDDDWGLPAEPAIPSDRASAYLIRLADERKQFDMLEFDREAFPPVVDFLAEASRAPQSRLIPHVRPRRQEVYPAARAKILDPRVETPDGQRVNLLIEGQPYVYCYEVEFLETCTNVFCRMAIVDRHHNPTARNATSSHERCKTVPQGTTLRVRFDFECNLRPDIYLLHAGVATSEDGAGLSYAHRIANAAAIIVCASPLLLVIREPRVTL
jgi:hypothetical protein